MTKKFIFTTATVLLVFTLNLGYVRADEAKINWLSMDQALQYHRQNPKKIFVNIYTSWCGWCKRMDAETFSHPVIVDYINTHFYPVKLNAEQTEPIEFGGVTYINERPDRRGTPHNFAVAILQGRLSYPAVAFFDESLNLIFALPGFRPPANMEAVLVFFNDDIFENNPNLDNFISNFQGRISR
ncbi:MAG TPA: DUF255 domain-containing protein [Bacteroidales bacterium]|nr:DUF255 domain-containing protein [Bacteroidales bacterium]